MALGGQGKEWRELSRIVGKSALGYGDSQAWAMNKAGQNNPISDPDARLLVRAKSKPPIGGAPILSAPVIEQQQKLLKAKL